MNIAEQIAALRHTRTQKAAAMQAVMTKGFTEKRSTTDEERTDFDGLKADIAALDADLSRLEELERVNKSLALAVPPTPAAPHEQKAAPVIEVKSNAKPLEKGIGFARYAMVLAKAQGNPMMAEQIASRQYPDSPQLATVLKAAVQAGNTTDATWAKPLVEYTTMASEFLEFLRPQTILGKFGQGGIPGLRRIPFNVRIPGQVSSGTANWVGEGKGIPLTKMGFDAATLSNAKVAGIMVITEELVRFSDPAAESLVRDGLRDAIVERLDIDFTNPAKALVAGVSPASITNGVTPLVPTGTGTVDNMRTDIQAMFAAYIAANMAPTSGVWIMSSMGALQISMMTNPLGQPEYSGISMNGGTLFGLPVIVSDYIAAGTVILANAQDIYLADDGEVMLDASREASIEMNDAPVANSNTGAGASMVSMFQTHSMAIRGIRAVNWQKRRAAAVQIITNARWAGKTGV